MKKSLFCLLLCMCCSILCACSSGSLSSADVDRIVEDALQSEESEDTQPETVSADGYELLGGSWCVAGFFYNNTLVDIHESEALEDLYDSTYLFFYEDGTFMYADLFISEGEYTPYKSDMEGISFLLKCQSVYRLGYEDGEVVQIESTSSQDTTYILTFLDEDNTIFQFSEFDAVTGRAVADDDPLVFTSSELSESTYSAASVPEDDFAVDDNSYLSDDSDSSSSPSKTASTGEKNALEQAKNYLSIMAFSYSGLVEQLEYEGYSHSEATYAVDNCGADWYDQAAFKAAEYLDIMSFSRSGLIEQLEYEGFTYEQASYGVDTVY